MAVVPAHTFGGRGSRGNAVCVSAINGLPERLGRLQRRIPPGFTVTTSSGKPPLDDNPIETGWDSAGNGVRSDAGASLDPPLPRESGAAAAPESSEAERPIFGAGVPYGGEERTEEIDPVALDAPFTSDERKRGTSVAAAIAKKSAGSPVAAAPPMVPRQTPAVPRRDLQMNAPAAQLMLSDLFDSTPPPGLMEPPDPAAFSSSRPPPPQSTSQPASAQSNAVSSNAVSSNAVVALPNISVTAEPARAERPSFLRRSSAPPSASSPQREERDAPASTSKRRSVPTLESTGNAASKAASAKSAGAADSEPPSDRNEISRLASEIPTSRPPDVVLAPGRTPSTRPAGRSADAEARPKQTAAAAAPPSSRGGNAQLPSIMLAPDVEAEPDVSVRRAQRASRATVRIEVPPDFGRPGAPVPASLYSSLDNLQASGAPLVRSPGIGFSLPKLPVEQRLESLKSRKGLWMAAGALLAIAVLVFALRPRPGSLVVTASGPGNRAVEQVQIFIDDHPPQLCATSPCRIEPLSPGLHKLRATATDLASQAEETVEITSGQEAIYNINLLGTESAVKAGALRIAAAETDLTLYVDGKRVGKLPQEVAGLAGGKHWIKLDAEDGSPAIEKSVVILAGETIDVEPNAAKRDKALVTIRLSPGSEGASVTLDDAFLLDFPAELELEPQTVHTLSASKPGYEDFSIDVQVEEGETEKLIEVALTPLDGISNVRKARAKTARKAAAAKASASAGDATQGLLNINSEPPSQIILNGRPLGNTPKTAIAVPGDSLQTIVFVHPTMGRRRAQKFVPAGKQRTVAIRF